MAPHSSTLAWKIHGRRTLVGCSPWGREESDTTERLRFHFLLLCIGEGNGNPLQCSCLGESQEQGSNNRFTPLPNPNSLEAKAVKDLPTIRETELRSLGWEDPLEKRMATHSSILAWKTP